MNVLETPLLSAVADSEDRQSFVGRSDKKKTSAVVEPHAAILTILHIFYTHHSLPHAQLLYQTFNSKGLVTTTIHFRFSVDRHDSTAIELRLAVTQSYFSRTAVVVTAA